MRVVAHMNNSVPHGRVGAFIATHKFYVGLVEAGHDLLVIVENRVGEYYHDGVHYQQEDPFTAEYIAGCDFVISLNGGSGHGHLAAVHAGKPSVKFAHGSSPGFIAQLHEWRDPDLVVFNSHSLAKLSGYTGEFIVCHPPIKVEDWKVERGEYITLVNLTDEKGAHTFDQLARFLPDHKFLAVQGGYGIQTSMWRRNLTVIDQTPNMRDEVYARTRILLMPGLLETWGMVGLEAMCSGIPVIAHPAMGPREAMGVDAMYADRDDLDAWIDKILKLDGRQYYNRWSVRSTHRAHQIASEDPVGTFVAKVEEMFG